MTLKISQNTYGATFTVDDPFKTPSLQKSARVVPDLHMTRVLF